MRDSISRDPRSYRRDLPNEITRLSERRRRGFIIDRRLGISFSRRACFRGSLRSRRNAINSQSEFSASLRSEGGKSTDLPCSISDSRLYWSYGRVSLNRYSITRLYVYITLIAAGANLDSEFHLDIIPLSEKRNFRISRVNFIKWKYLKRSSLSISRYVCFSKRLCFVAVV